MDNKALGCCVWAEARILVHTVVLTARSSKGSCCIHVISDGLFSLTWTAYLCVLVLFWSPSRAPLGK